MDAAGGGCVLSLTPEQKAAAAELLKTRPPTFPRSRVIVKDADREVWHKHVAQVMAELKVSSSDVHAFCDEAGVA